jgi:N-hydroxyarylamine O-acetyltransferase
MTADSSALRLKPPVMPNLEAYFARIGYSGTREPTLATLTAIHRHHARAIPFENLDVLLGRGIRIDPASVQEKLITERRGGYCFEQNGLLFSVLTALSFRVTPLIARVRWQVPDDVPTPLTHMLLRVETECGPQLCDVGFGSMSLKQPLALKFDLEQPGSSEPRRLVRRSLSGPDPAHYADQIRHQVRIGDDWLDAYHFTLEPAHSMDFELGNWFTSSHPQSRFIQNLVVARLHDTHRCTLMNREYTVRHDDGRVEKRIIESPEELLRVLADDFSLHFPSGTRFGSAGAPWPT